ncbi:MAG: MBL fold metallo-hydrolase [Clostridia bacterium]|nr:MBL fold metallo-hydrolase [Clostridia bacterium]
MKIVALKYGESVFGENNIFYGGDEANMLPITFVVYLLQTKDKNILVDAGCDDGAGFKMSVFKKPVEVLEEYGLTSDDITDVIITHSHRDHIGAVGHYKKATIHIQKDEYESGRKYIGEGNKINLFDEIFEVCHGVLIKKIGGHTKNSSIVVAEDKYVLCGDECYYKECFDRGIITGSSKHPDKSRAFMEEYGDEKYKLLFFHDKDIFPGEVGYFVIK